MSDRHQAPDLLDELLGFDESSSAEEDQAVEQPEATADEPKPRRRWWRRQRRPVPPDAVEAADGHEPSEEPAEPPVAEDGHELSEESPESAVAEPAPEPEKDEGPAEPQEQSAAGDGAESEEEEVAERPSDEVVGPPAPRRRGGRHLQAAGDESATEDSADGSDPSSLGKGASVLPPPLGPRRSARTRRRSRARLFVGVGGALLALAAAATLLPPSFLETLSVPSFRDDPQPQNTTSAPTADALVDPVRTVLLYGAGEVQSTEAAWMTLLSLNFETQEGSVVYVPAHTATEVPGRGLLGIGESLGSGPSLLEVSTETLLGVPVDDRLQVTPEGALAIFEGLGDVSVDVPSELRVPAGEGRVRLLIPQGPQQLSPDELVSLLFRPGIEGDDAELGGRHLALWSGVLGQYADDPEALANAVSGAEPPPGFPAHTERIGAFLSDLAQLPASSRILANLPVKEVSVGSEELYETDAEELSAFVGETIGETDLAADLSRVQVLNGNGVPGIGVEVAEKLVGNGFRIILSGNADRLDYYSTRIVSYDSSPEGVATARQARALLGLGKVQVSSQGQGIVDLTIVVGRDFLRTR